jgi:hypothetical protein
MARTSNLFALAATSALLVSGVAHAGPIVYTVNSADPTQAEADFLLTLGSKVTETFESFTAPYQSKSVVTSVGTFIQDVAGSGGACGTACDDGLVVLNSTTTPFNGRFNTTDPGENWLDSFDSKKVVFLPNADVNAIGFYITDPNDAGGLLGINSVSGTHYVSFTDIFGGSKSNGSLYYVTFNSDDAITALFLASNDPNDGYGIDDVTVGRVPEPGTLALLGLGLLGVGLMRRRG